jgi:CRP/FNR family transcriptional regulator
LRNKGRGAKAAARRNGAAMDKSGLLCELQKKFDFFAFLPEDEREHLLGAVVFRAIPAGTVLPGTGECGGSVPLVVSGRMRASRISEGGREIELYTIEPGETCIISVACLLGLGRCDSVLTVTADCETLVAFLPADKFRYVYSESPYLQKFVFCEVMNKFYRMTELVETLSFKSIGERVSDYLGEMSGHGKKPVYITHAQLAAKLGTSREVVTRSLARLEGSGAIKTERGKIIFTGSEKP